MDLRKTLAAAGATMDDIVKATVYIADIDYYEKMNEVYMTFFEGPTPARSTIVTRLVMDEILVEIEAVAYKPRPKSLQVLIREVLEAAQPLGDPGPPVAYAEVVPGVVEDHPWPDHDVLLLGVLLGELLDVHPDELGKADGGAFGVDPLEVVTVVLEELVH